jgi:hypothetical protein
MYQISPSNNELIRLSPKRFAELGFTERAHLQEWIAKCPSSLGEDLLVIQKEFDGFDETRERLDLLAIDKQGGLVLIENKLDDSGRDLVWQSLKYASYCSSLSKSTIQSIYQDYLNRHHGGGDAKEKLCEFLEKDDISDVILNSGNDQRIILVAANFRREVTSTVLWLLQHGIRLQCFKATPFQHGEQVFLTLEQIIPTPGVEDFMIGVSEKEKEQHSVERVLANRIPLRLAFWEATLDAFERAGITLYRNVSPGRDHWLNAGSGVCGLPFTLVFSKSEVRVELNFTRPRKDRNKQIFDWFFAEKIQIESTFGEKLEWQRLDDKKSCRVVYRKDFDGFDRQNWPEMILWLTEHIQRLEKAMQPHIATVGKRLKSLAEGESVETSEVTAI